LQHGITEEQLAQVDSYEHSDLTDAQKVALRLADVYLTAPSEMSDELREEVLRYYTPAQVVELLVRLIGWTRNKPMVALGLELDEVRSQVY